MIKKVFDDVRSETKVKDRVSPPMNYEGRIVADQQDMGNILNGYLGSVFAYENIK